MILKNLKAVPSTDASDIIRMRDSVYASDLLITAIARLNFFSWLSDNPSNLYKICDHFEIHPRPTDAMITLFKAMHLVKEEKGKIRITVNAREYLTQESEWNMIPYFNTQAKRPIVDTMLNVLKSGAPAKWSGKSELEDWERAMVKDDFADMYTEGMESRGAYFAPGLARSFDFSKYKSIIDVAGGAGIYAATIKAYYPHIETALLERSPVDKLAKRVIEERGMTQDIKVIPGDMFHDELPRGYDIHLFSHVLHDWNSTQNKILIKNSFHSLNPGGMIMIHGAHLNSDKTGPLSVAEYSTLLMFSTYGKCYSIMEMEDLLAGQGFVNLSFESTIGNRSIITGIKEA